MRRWSCLFFLPLIAGTLAAQAAPRSIIRVVDGDGRPVPYAAVNVANGATAIADDAGRVTLNMPPRDSLNVTVRRIGYKPLDARVTRAASDGAYVVAMTRLPSPLDTVRVVAQQSTPLARTGFYDRVERVRKGAYTAEFITPEELDARNPSQVSSIFQGRRTTSIIMFGGGGTRQQAVLLGRGRCAMTIVVDGQQVTNTLQEAVVSAGAPQSMYTRGSSQVSPGKTTIGLDDIVDGRSVMGIEIYPSTANAPAELIPIGGRGSCGFVAIWTGPRR
jgi:hypothetical protein